MNRINAILFDLDGTLLDSAPDLVAALNFVRQKEGLPALEVKGMSQFVSHGAVGLINAGMPGCNEQEFELRKALFLERYAGHSFVSSRLYEGIPDLLKFLEHSGIPWGIVTNKNEALTKPIMKASGLEHRASCVVCGDTLALSKPHPAPVVLACALLEVEASNTLFVGDDVRDVQAGRAAGTQTAVVHYGYGSSEFSEEWLIGSIGVNHPSDLIEQVKKQNV